MGGTKKDDGPEPVHSSSAFTSGFLLNLCDSAAPFSDLRIVRRVRDYEGFLEALRHLPLSNTHSRPNIVFILHTR